MTKNNVFGFTTNCPCRSIEIPRYAASARTHFPDECSIDIYDSYVKSFTKIDVEIAGLGISKVYLGDKKALCRNCAYL